VTEDTTAHKKTRHRPFTPDDMQYVQENYAHKTAGRIGEELGLSKFQVSKMVGILRRRGAEIPRKTGRRPDPVLIYLEEEGLAPKGKTPEKPAGKRSPRKNSKGRQK